MRLRALLVSASVASAGMLAPAAVARAQDDSAVAKAAPPATRKLSATEEAKKKGPRRVLRLEGDVIEGKAIKPEAFYLLNRASISFEGLKLETKMVPKILKQLRKPPF